MAKARSGVLFSLHREEIWTFDRRLTASHLGLWPRETQEIVGYLKSSHGMGHGHANALVGWTLAGNVARS
jgi:hypothetical protein